MNTAGFYFPDVYDSYLIFEIDRLIFLRDTFRMTLFPFGETCKKKACGIEIKINGETQTKQMVELAAYEWFDYSELLRNFLFSAYISTANYCNGMYHVLNYWWPIGYLNLSEKNIEITFYFGNESRTFRPSRAIDTHSPKWFETNQDVYDVDCGVWPIDVWDRYGGVWLMSPDGDIATQYGDVWCGYENCEKTPVFFGVGTAKYCLGADTYGTCNDWEPAPPTSHVATVTVTGVSPQNEECGGAQKNKVPMAKVMYIRTDGITIERWAEVVEEAVNTSVEQEKENLLTPQFFYINSGDPYPLTTNTYYTSTRNIYSRKIKVAWRKFPAAERKQIAMGIAQTPTVLIRYNGEVLAAKLNNTADFSFGNDGDLEIDFNVKNIEINRCSNTLPPPDGDA